MNSKEILLSIIIPVYNVEKYIEKCLETTTSCNSDNYEVIIINDGTKDNSMSIVDKFKKKHNDRITIINQENQGLSKTRNNGINEASGKYLWFIDSDDFLEEDSIQNILNEIKENNPETFIIPITYNYSNGVRKPDIKIDKKLNITGENYLLNKYPFGASVRFIISKDFILKYNLFFKPNLLHEDGDFGIRVLFYGQKIQILNNEYYNYRIQENGSIMSSWKEKNSSDLIYISESLHDLLKNSPLIRNYNVYYNAVFRILLASILFAKNHWSSEVFKQFYKKRSNNIRNTAIKLIKGCSFINKFKVFIFIISPLYYAKGIQILKK